MRAALVQRKKKVAKPKRLRTFHEAYAEISPTSFLSAKIKGPLTSPNALHIRLKGAISTVPSLKNQKIKGTNILRPDAKAHLCLMSELFQRTVARGAMFPAKQELFLLVSCAYRKVSFDTDNVFTTVKDWLEPRIIRKSDREWGVGVVENDKTIIGMAVKKPRGIADSDITDIYIVPAEAVGRPLCGLLYAVKNSFD